jgi:hypothetical protein
MDALRSTSRVASGLVPAACWFLAVAPVQAQAILGGTVIDATTGLPIPGVEVKVQHSGQVVGSATSDGNGIYQVPFTAPAPDVTMVAAANSPNHTLATRPFQVIDGAASGAHDIALFPIGVTACQAGTLHSVIVGHFLPPLSSSRTDFPERVARSLESALNIRLQAVYLPPELQPSFEDCAEAKPKTPKFGARLARALGADAFVGGNIADDPPAYTVSTYVSDAHDLFPSPPVITSRSINLENFDEASISNDAYAAVLGAIAAGLAKNDCVTAITVVKAATDLVEPDPPYLADLRAKCEARIPNTGLLGPGR